MPSLLDQAPLDLGHARARLGELRALVWRRAAIGTALAAAGIALLLLGSEALGIPLLIGAAAAGLLVALGRDDRRRLLIRLVAQDDAWAIEEVRSAGERLVSPPERRRLAGGLRHAAASSVPRHAEFSMVDPFRATETAERLRELASRVGDLAVPLRPPGAALCRRLLSEGRLSPLYNPNLADAELDQLIERIERAAGLRR